MSEINPVLARGFGLIEETESLVVKEECPAIPRVPTFESIETPMNKIARLREAGLSKSTAELVASYGDAADEAEPSPLAKSADATSRKANAITEFLKRSRASSADCEEMCQKLTAQLDAEMEADGGELINLVRAAVKADIQAAKAAA